MGSARPVSVARNDGWLAGCWKTFLLAQLYHLATEPFAASPQGLPTAC
jgi:hypothetical protein